MIDLDLNQQQLRWYNQTLAGSHQMRVRVFLCDLAGNRLKNFTHILQGGQVNVDTAETPVRNATVEILDVGRSMAFVPDSPHEAGIFYNRMLQIIYDVFVPQMSQWVAVPIFTGPIREATPADELLTIECVGKEVLAQGEMWRARQFKKGRRRRDVIRDLLAEEAGEDQFRMPPLPKQRLPKDMRIPRNAVPWSRCKKIAKGLGDRQLFYNGRGVVRLRARPEKPVFTFRDGSASSQGVVTVMTPPVVTYSLEEVKNAVRVVGGFPRTPPDRNANKDDEEKETSDANEKKRKRIEAEWVAPRENPLSPWRLGAGGAELYLVEHVSDDSLRSKAEANEVALRRGRRNLDRHIEVGFESLVVPYLEEGDMVRVNTDEFDATVVLDAFTIPLTHGETMSVGYTDVKDRRVSKREKRLRRKNNKAERTRQRMKDRRKKKSERKKRAQRQKEREQEKQEAGED